VSEAVGRPIVVAVCSIPLVHEALAVALDGIADVQSFPAGHGDTAGERKCPLVHLSLRQRTMRLRRGRGWEEPIEGVSPEAIRNLLVGELFGARARP
jgi:hypothetical protein